MNNTDTSYRGAEPSIMVTVFGLNPYTCNVSEWVHYEIQDVHTAVDIAQEMLENPTQFYEEGLDSHPEYYRTYLITDIEAFTQGLEEL